MECVQLAAAFPSRKLACGHCAMAVPAMPHSRTGCPWPKPAASELADRKSGSKLHALQSFAPFAAMGNCSEFASAGSEFSLGPGSWKLSRNGLPHEFKIRGVQRHDSAQLCFDLAVLSRTLGENNHTILDTHLRGKFRENPGVRIKSHKIEALAGLPVTRRCKVLNH